MSVNVERYDRVQIILHWLIAAMILTMIVLGLFMVQLPKQSELPPGEESVRAFWFLLHKSLGMTVAIFVLLRVVWRLTHKAPPLPDYLPKWQEQLSRLSHGLLYGLMVAMPISGYLQSMYSKYDTKFWGMVLPRLAEADDAKREIFTEVHEVLAFTLIAVLLVHITAAMKHRIAGNDISKRMSLFRSK